MKILIPLVGSKFSEAIISSAAKFVVASGAEVHLISVVKESDAHSSWYEIPGRDAPHAAGVVPLDMGAVTDRLGGRVAETRVQAEERMLQQATDYLNHIVAQFFPGLLDPRYAPSIVTGPRMGMKNKLC